MSLSENGGLSAADIAAVTGSNNGFGFGGDGAWWLLVLFLFAFNGGGFGNGFLGSSGGIGGEVQRGFDQSSVMSGINGLSSAVTNGFSNAAVAQCNQTSTMLQGINGIQSQMSNDRFDVVNAISNLGTSINATIMQNEMARQQCCCDTKQAIGDVKYAIATENCADREALSNGIRDIISNQTAATQAILDKMCQQEIDALKAQNAALQTQLNIKALGESQAAQTAQLIQDNNAQTAALINRIAPYPVPAYTVPNPVGAQYGGCMCQSIA